MANRFFGINRGQTAFSVVEDSSTQTKDVELNIDLSKNLTKAEVAQLLEMIENYIITKSQYPAS